jgi:hypothetical protein
MKWVEKKTAERYSFRRGLTLVLSLALAVGLTAVTALAQEGRLVREKVHGSSLEKTVTGENPDRSVTI